MFRINLVQLSALSGKEGQDTQDDVSPANMRNAIGQLTQLGFSKEDCANALKNCQGHLVSLTSLSVFQKIISKLRLKAF